MISNFIAMFGNTVQSSSQGSAASAQGGFGSMLPLILIFGAMILLMIVLGPLETIREKALFCS